MASAAVEFAAPLQVQGKWATSIFTLSIVLPVLTTIAVAGRCLARRERRVKIGTNDWLMFIALFLFFAHSIVYILLVVLGGAGRHAETLQPSVKQNSRKLLFANSWTYTLSLGFAKLSVCSLFVQIFSVVKWLRRALWATFTFIIVWIFLNLMLTLTTCQPISKQWDISLPGHCVPATPAVEGVGVIDIFIDLLLLLLPLPQVLHLQLPTPSKLGLVALFALGWIDFAIGIRRVTYAPAIKANSDFTWNLAQLDFWTVMRPGLAIIIGCALVMRPLLERLLLAFGQSKAGFYIGREDHVMSPVAKQQASNEDVANLLKSHDRGDPGETRGIAMTRSVQPRKTSLALPSHSVNRPQPVLGRLRDRDAVINVHRFVQVEEEQIGVSSQEKQTSR